MVKFQPSTYSNPSAETPQEEETPLWQRALLLVGSVAAVLFVVEQVGKAAEKEQAESAAYAAHIREGARAELKRRGRASPEYAFGLLPEKTQTWLESEDG